MKTGIFTLLFNTGQIVDDSWTFNTATPDETLMKLRQLAPARRSLLASNVRIVLLKVTGKPLQRVDFQGTGGTFAWPTHALIVRHKYRAVKKQLRGVPKELYDVNGLTPHGHQVFREFNRTLTLCGCVLVRTGEPPETISSLTPDYMNTLTWKHAKVATKKKLLALLGPEKGEQFWEALKASRERRTVSNSPTAGLQVAGFSV